MQYFIKINEAPRKKLRGIKAEFRRSQPAFALMSYGAVHLAIQPWIKPRVFWRRRIKTSGKTFSLLVEVI